MDLTSALLTAIIGTILNVLAFIYMIKGPTPKRKGPTDPLSICFLYPELVKNGMEVHVIEMAIALQNLGHHVEIFTCHYDKSKCYTESVDGVLDIHVHGMMLPRTIFGFFSLECTIFRVFWATIRILLRHKERNFDLVFVSQISTTIPIFRVSNIKAVFYCRLRDLTASNGKCFIFKHLTDTYAMYTANKAALVFFDSRFALSKSKKLKVGHQILHPCINFRIRDYKKNSDSTPYLLYLNDFEKSSNFEFAIDVFGLLIRIHPELKVKLHLVGSFQLKRGNVKYLNELKKKIKSMQIESDVEFFLDVSFAERNQLFLDCKVVLYTSSDIGYSMLEAGFFSKPVLAYNSGGPLEIVKDEETGYLRPLDSKIWADKIFELLTDSEKASRMGQLGFQRIQNHFSSDVLILKLETALRDIVATY